MIKNSLYILCLLFFTAPARLIGQPLVDGAWLVDNLDKANLLVLDLQAQSDYKKYHIPGAVNSHYADWRIPDANGTPKMVPPVALLEKLIGSLGIDNQTLVVLVVTGRHASEMASATRVYWTLRALGHDAVSILDGGLIDYARERDHPLEKQTNAPTVKTFKAHPRAEYLVGADQVEAALGRVTLVDNRSVGEYLGLIRGDDKERPGTLPGSVNLPFEWLTVNGGAVFHQRENLQRIYKAAGVPLQGEQISFCHTGHRASLVWFVSHELLGNEKARLYDGSTAEWARKLNLPMERKIKLE